MATQIRWSDGGAVLSDTTVRWSDGGIFLFYEEAEEVPTFSRKSLSVSGGSDVVID